MPTQRYIYMNGVQFNPSSFEYDEEKLGDSYRTDDGTLRFHYRATKRKWTIQWTNVRETYMTSIKALAALTTSFTLVDYDNISWTVMLLPGAFKYSINAENVDGSYVKRYNVTLVLDQV